MNTLSYAIPEEEFISLYQGTYTVLASVTFFSPYQSDIFDDAEIIVFDYRQTPPSAPANPLTLFTQDENGNDLPFATLDTTDGSVSFIDLTDSGIIIFSDTSGQE